MRIWIGVTAVVFLISLRLAWASGCFGGSPDISPRDNSMNVPSNGRITIARRVPAGVSWFGPDGRQIAFSERQAGFGPSAARILTSDAPLPPGSHRIQTTDPDVIHKFIVLPSADSLPPRLAGLLTLEALNTPEPSSECPENIFIRARFPAPQDDKTDTKDLTYLLWIRPMDTQGAVAPDLLLPAEAIVRGEVYLRFGETGCGCIPQFKLQPGTTYRITLRALDLAGNESADTLSGTVAVPRPLSPPQR